MKRKKPSEEKPKETDHKTYEMPISLWPLKPEEALRLFMQVDRSKIKD